MRGGSLARSAGGSLSRPSLRTLGDHLALDVDPEHGRALFARELEDGPVVTEVKAPVLVPVDAPRSRSSSRRPRRAPSGPGPAAPRPATSPAPPAPCARAGPAPPARPARPPGRHGVAWCSPTNTSRAPSRRAAISSGLTGSPRRVSRMAPACTGTTRSRRAGSPIARSLGSITALEVAHAPPSAATRNNRTPLWGSAMSTHQS